MPESRKYQGVRRAQILALDEAYDDLIKEIANIYSKIKHDPDKVFRFRNEKGARKQKATEAFRNYRKKVMKVIEESQKQGWEEATETFKKKRLERLELVKAKITQAEFDQQLRTIEAIRVNYQQLENFMNRKIGRVSISSRVWDIQDMARQNIEDALTDALGRGKNAQELARSIKRSLNNPDALFRRVRDKHGNLAPSKPMRKYNPGRGVYRSAHKNAMRLARTEINAAYKRSEQASMLRNNDIVAQRIRTSHSHTTEDICDALQGDYPKDFIWEGWHIQCKCIREFIQKTDEEFIADIKGKKNTASHLSKNYIKEPPPQFKKWVNENSQKIAGWKSKPNFLTDNGY